MFGIHRADLIEMLAAALPDGAVRTGHRCVGFTQDDHGATVSFADGTSVTTDVVIGADGIHSALQRHVVAPAEPEFSGSVAYRGIVPADRIPEWPRDEIQAWMGPGRHFLVYPLRAGTLLGYVGFVEGDATMRESWSTPGDPQELAAAFAGWDPIIGKVLRELRTTMGWGLYDRPPLPRWSVGRLTLLGDAAHPMLPHLGQGANQAIEDGVALATLLEEVDITAVADALTRYETLRRARTAHVQQSARENGGLYEAADAEAVSRDDRIRGGCAVNGWLYGYDAESEARSVRI